MPEKLTAKMVAERMNGREYMHEIGDDEENELVFRGLVVVFGYSDDNVELRGAITEEVGCYEHGTIPILDGDIFVPPCGDDCERYDCQLLKDAYRRSKSIRAEFKSDGWKFDADFPYEKFVIMEDGKVFGEGIVFDLEDLKHDV